MKKLMIAVVITACLALCAAVWPQGEVVEEPTREIAVNTPETPVVTSKEKTEVLPQTEKENTEPQQPELPQETVHEPEATPTATPAVTEVPPTPEPTPTAELASDPTPAQTAIDPQPSNMVYVEGFGWLESQGEGTVIHDDMMYENGNKVGIMD